MTVPPPRRIVFLIRKLGIGGAEGQLVELASGMQQAGWRVKVVTFYRGGELEADLRARGVTVITLDKRGRWDLFTFPFHLVRAIRRERPDVLHGYLEGANVASVLIKWCVPRLRVVWGVRASNVDLARYDWLVHLAFWISCRLARFADCIVCNSIAGRNFHLAKGYPAERTVVVPNGIDTDRFKPDPIARHEVRREWSIRDDHVLIGMVGRLDPMKDHPTFLRAAARIKDRKDLRFVCVGDGPEPYRSLLMNLASDLGLKDRMTWTSRRTDMSRVYNAFDLAVSSSSGEGFPNVVAEAMATEVPCVVTNVGDSAMLVGEGGWVCRSLDPIDLARAMDLAISSSSGLAATGQRARRRILAEFSPERLVAATTRQLDELLRPSR